MSSSPWVMGARHATFSAPPSRSDPSYSATSWPRSRATRPASRPAGPPPITTTRRGCAVVPITSSPYCFSLPTAGFTVQPRRRLTPLVRAMQPWLQPMHGRTSAARPSRVLRTMSGSAMCARTIDTRSHSPVRSACSASSSVRKRPVTMRGMPVTEPVILPLDGSM